MFLRALGDVVERIAVDAVQSVPSEQRVSKGLYCKGDFTELTSSIGHRKRRSRSSTFGSKQIHLTSICFETSRRRGRGDKERGTGPKKITVKVCIQSVMEHLPVEAFQFYLPCVARDSNLVLFAPPRHTSLSEYCSQLDAKPVRNDGHGGQGGRWRKCQWQRGQRAPRPTVKCPGTPRWR